MTIPTFRPASFRNVPFALKEYPEHGGGQRTVEHEIFEGKGFTEPTGDELDDYPIQAVVSGEGYQDVAARLETAGRARGAGALVHPTKGTLSVVVKSWRAVVKRGAVEFKIEFQESGEPTDFLPDELPTVTKWTDVFKGLLNGALVKNLSVVGQMADVAADAVKQVNDAASAVLDAARKYGSPAALGRIVQQVSNLTATAEATVRAPSDLAAGWQAVGVQMARTGQRACAAACVAIPLPVLSNEPSQTEFNAYAHASFVRSILASAACDALVSSIPPTADEATAAMVSTAALVELVGEQSDDPDTWRAACDLRDATLRIVGDASVRLPRLRSWTPVRPTSVFEASQALDAGIDDLLTRNAIVNPLWISAPLTYVEPV